jgi:hypothetical protein
MLASPPIFVSSMSSSNQRDACTILYSSLNESGQKMSAIEYDGVTVSGQNLSGTILHMSVRCSPAVHQRFLKFTEDGDGGHDLVKAEKVIAILWRENYERGSEWEMDEDQRLWDEAVNSVLDRCGAALRLNAAVR